MKKLWQNLKYRFRRIKIWFWMRSIKRDLARIDNKLIKAHELDKS